MGSKATMASPPGVRVRRDRRGRGSVRIRAIRPTDARDLERFYAALSPESRRTRFFSSSVVGHAQTVSFCTTDHDHREGFVAVIGGAPVGRERIVGHLCIEPDGADAAEVAIAVADEHQRQGVGRQLMAAGTAWARSENIARFTATMFEGNAPIHRLFCGLGMPIQIRPVGAGLAEITIDLAGERLVA